MTHDPMVMSGQRLLAFVGSDRERALLKLIGWVLLAVCAAGFCVDASADSPTAAPAPLSPGTVEWKQALTEVRETALTDLPKALQQADHLLAIVAEHPNDAAELELLNTVLRPFFVGGRTEEGLKLADRAISLARKLHDRAGEGQALYNKMASLHQLGRYQEALELGPATIEAQRAAGEVKARHLTVALMGILNRRLGQFDEAVTILMDGLQRAENEVGSDDVTLIGRYHNALGALYGDIGDYDRALPHFERALESFKKVGDLPVVSTILGNIALCTTKQGDHARSVTVLNEAVELKRRSGDELGLPSLLIALAESNLAMGNLGQARAAAEEVIKLREKQSSLVALPSAYAALAQVHRREGRSSEAETQLLLALAAAEKSGNAVSRKSIHQELSELYAEMDGSTRALKHARDAVALDQQIASETAKKRLTELDRRYEIARKDRELSALRMKSQQQEAEISARRARQHFWVMIAMTTGAGLFVAGALLLQLRRKHQLLRETHAQLTQTMAELNAAQAKLVEASRAAGAAELAAGVVHHVGNLLNSVNVSIGVMHERVAGSRALQIQRVAELLAQQPDVARFLSEDPRGKSVVPYLAALGNQVAGERDDLQQELVRLRGHVEDIIRVVRSQEAYVRAPRPAGTVTEPVDSPVSRAA